jgi:hypothetical protein
MALMDVLEAAQGGRFFVNAGAAAGVDPARAQAALGAMCPAIAETLRKKAEDEAAFDRLLDMLEDGDGDAFLDDPNLLADPEVHKDGTAILADIYGSKQAAWIALQSAAKDLKQEELAKLAPIGAASVLAALGRANASKLGIADNTATQESGGGLLGTIISAVAEGVMKGAARSLAPKRRRRRYTGYYRARRPARRRTRRPSLNDIFGELLGIRR